MRKIILVTSGLLLTAMLQAQSWQMKPWQKYLIDEQVKQDTMRSCRSVMGAVAAPKPYDTRLFRTVTGSEFIKALPFHKKKSKSFFDASKSPFDEEDRRRESERIAREGYHTSDFIADLIADVIDIFILKSK